MTIMSPSTCSQALRGQAVTFMLREVMLIVDLEWYSTHLSSFMPLPTLCRADCLACTWCNVGTCAWRPLPYAFKILALSWLKWSPHKHTYIHTYKYIYIIIIYIYIHIKLLPVPRVFGARSGSFRINNTATEQYNVMSCMHNHALCGSNHN